MERTYHLCKYRIDNRDGYLIWYCDDTDGIVTGAGRTVLEYSGPEHAARYAADHRFTISQIDEPAGYDFDEIERWIQSGGNGEVRCEDFLEAWNLFIDVSFSVKGDFDSDIDRTAGVYEKLFYGNNLPGITPPGEKYIPEWKEEELLLLRDILSDGLWMFRDNVSRAPE